MPGHKGLQNWQQKLDGCKVCHPFQKGPTFCQLKKRSGISGEFSKFVSSCRRTVEQFGSEWASRVIEFQPLSHGWQHALHQVTQVSIQSSQFIQNTDTFSFRFHFLILKIPPLSPEYFFLKFKGRLIFLNIQLSPKETQNLLAVEKVKRKPWNKHKLNKKFVRKTCFP